MDDKEDAKFWRDKCFSDAVKTGELQYNYNELKAEIERLREAISYLPKIPTQPYEKELARDLLEAKALIQEMADLIKHAKGLYKDRYPALDLVMGDILDKYRASRFGGEGR